MMGKRLNCRKGFTLIEMIVVVAIIAVLIALVAPRVAEYVNTAETIKCRASMAMVAKNYALKAINDDNVDSAEGTRRHARLKAALSITTGETADNTANTYKAACGGTCTVTFNAGDVAIVSITCDKHGTTYNYGGTTRQDVSESGMEELFKGEEVSKLISKYIKDRADTGDINSTGKNYAPDMLEALKKAGFDTENSSWRINWNKKNKTYDIIWTDTQIGEKSLTDTVRYVRKTYNYDTGTQVGSTVTGTVGLEDKNTGTEVIRILDPGNITVDETPGASWD